MKIQITTRSSRATLTPGNGLPYAPNHCRVPVGLLRRKKADPPGTRPQLIGRWPYSTVPASRGPKTGVDKTGRRVGQQAQTTQRGHLQAGATSSGGVTFSTRRAQHELTRMQDERLVGSHLHQTRQVLLRLRGSICGYLWLSNRRKKRSISRPLCRLESSTHRTDQERCVHQQSLDEYRDLK